MKKLITFGVAALLAVSTSQLFAQCPNCASGGAPSFAAQPAATYSAPIYNSAPVQSYSSPVVYNSAPVYNPAPVYNAAPAVSYGSACGGCCAGSCGGAIVDNGMVGTPVDGGMIMGDAIGTTVSGCSSCGQSQGQYTQGLPPGAVIISDTVVDGGDVVEGTVEGAQANEASDVATPPTPEGASDTVVPPIPTEDSTPTEATDDGT